jgi:hypothetical protein
VLLLLALALPQGLPQALLLALVLQLVQGLPAQSLLVPGLAWMYA